MKKNKVRFYSTFADDFEISQNQDFILPEDYKWVGSGLKYTLLSALIYGLAVLFSSIYCKFFLHMKIRGSRKLRKTKGGCYIFGNHTQPVGDVFIPALCALPKRIYTVVSTANYGIPVIGKILPYLGALPTVDNLHGIKELSRAMEHHLNGGHPIVIYPEAHVWEYYTGIRPFPDTSFKFPVKFNVPSFAMTVTYKKRKLSKKPTMEVFIDGPFFGEGTTSKEKTETLHGSVYNTMLTRSQNSNCEYILYKEAIKNSTAD